MTKAEVLKELRQGVYCRLKPSPIQGVGVFAIRDIPAGVNPMYSAADTSEWLDFTEAEIESLDPAVKQYVKDECVHEGTTWYIPDYGINMLSVAYFLNHSATPNMQADEEGENFTALRDIKAGEELTVDYRTYDDQPDPFK